MPRSGFVSTSSYLNLKRGLTPLLDRNRAKPYSGRAISTPKARLLMMWAFFGAFAVLMTAAFRSAFANTQI
jgi:hypothetical protein